MAKTKEIKFHGYATKMKLVSNNLCYGPAPECGEEIEQRLTLSKDGSLVISGHSYDESGGMVELRQLQDKISPECANMLLASIGYEMTQMEEVRCTDVGTWKLELTNEEGEVFVSYGSLIPNQKQLKNISDDFRKSLGRKELFVFDGEARFSIKKNPDEKVFIKITELNKNDGEWYFFEGDDIYLGKRFVAPTLSGNNSLWGEVVDIMVATPENGPVSIKKQEKMPVLSVDNALPPEMNILYDARKKSDFRF